jgi:hypothetical protein
MQTDAIKVVAALIRDVLRGGPPLAICTRSPDDLPGICMSAPHFRWNPATASAHQR